MSVFVADKEGHDQDLVWFCRKPHHVHFVQGYCACVCSGWLVGWFGLVWFALLWLGLLWWVGGWVGWLVGWLVVCLSHVFVVPLHPQHGSSLAGGVLGRPCSEKETSWWVDRPPRRLELLWASALSSLLWMVEILHDLRNSGMISW